MTLARRDGEYIWIDTNNVDNKRVQLTGMNQERILKEHTNKICHRLPLRFATTAVDFTLLGGG